MNTQTITPGATFAVAYDVTTSAYAKPSEHIVLSGLASLTEVSDCLIYSAQFGTVTNVTITSY